MKIAVLFDNFGPYHLARLNAATAAAEILGVEFAAASAEYAWRRDAGGETFQRRTLFTGGTSRDCPTPLLRTELNSALDEFRPNAVAIPGWSGRLAFAALEWARRSAVPVSVMSESTADDRRRSRWKELVKSRCLEACSAALVGGQRHQDYLVQLGMPPERIFFGYNAVDNAHFAAGADAARASAEAMRRQLGLPERYFLASARFVEEKNLPSLLQAFAQYRRKITPVIGQAPSAWDLVLLGDGRLRPELEALRDSLGLRSCVHMPGFKEYQELPAYFGLASALVHASSVEPWGLVVNEAMAAGLPVLVSDKCGCADELVHEGENGFRLEPASIDDIAAGLKRLAQLPETDRQTMGRRSAEIVADYGPEAFALGLEQAAYAAMTSDLPRPRGTSLLLAALLKASR